MSKKKRFQKDELIQVFQVVEYLISNSTKYISRDSEYFFQNIFRVSMSFKQLFFTLTTLSTEFTKLFSTGVILKLQMKFFKFFKKSIHCINPLVMVIRYSFINFFKELYIIECVNYAKKQHLFLKKLLSSLKSQIKFLVFKKAYAYTTKPVKRIKRRVVKLLKNL